ncbi:MAG: hypothetical protein K0B10_04265 [Vicingaceae bacterium]|nr:hypothetical protein [Vicingaceae bacterium]
MFILLSFVINEISAQSSDSTIWKPTTYFATIGIVFQDAKAFEGMITKGVMTNKHDYIVAAAGLGGYKINKWSLYPIIGVKSAIIFKNTVGINFNTLFWWLLFDDKKQPLIFTPEIGFRITIIEFNYGYNIPFGDNPLGISKHRFSIRVGI